MNEKTNTKLLFTVFILNVILMGSMALFILDSNNTHENLKTSIMALREPQMIVFLKVEYEEITHSYPLEQVKTPSSTYDNDSNIKGWDFAYQINGLTINNSFRYIYLEISMKHEDYLFYSAINCEWAVEDNSGVVRRDKFEESSLYHGYYTALEELGRNFWKEDIPNEIELEISLSL